MMRLKCKQIMVNSQVMTEHGFTNDVLTVGREYIPLAVYLHDGDVLFQIESEEGELLMFSGDRFCIMSNYIPSNWEINFTIKSNGEHCLNLSPKAWKKVRYESGNGFYEEIGDVPVPTPLEGYKDKEYYPEVLKLYFKERNIIYREEELYGDKDKEKLGE